MKSTKSIWLNEYEGLLPTPAAQRKPKDGLEAPVLTEYEAVSPHFELTPANLEKTTPLAFFE